MYGVRATSELDSMLFSSYKGASIIDQVVVPDEPLVAPDYTNSEEFKKFLVQNQTQIQSNNSGYIIILLDKDNYTTGELVRGSVLIDVFHESYQKDIFIKFKGEQLVPQQLQNKIDDRCIELAPNDSNDMHEIDDLAFNYAEENDIFIRRPSVISNAKFSIHSDVMSIRSHNFIGLRRGSNRETPSHSPLKVARDREYSGFTSAIKEENTQISSNGHEISDPELPSRNIFSGDTNDFRDFQSKLPGYSAQKKRNAQEQITMEQNNLRAGHRPSFSLLKEIRGKADMVDIFTGQPETQSPQFPSLINTVNQKSNLNEQGSTHVAENPRIQKDQIERQQSAAASVSNQSEKDVTEIVEILPQSAIQQVEEVKEVKEEVKLIKKEQASYLIFKLDVRLFKFRGERMQKGQYEFPFTFKIPKKDVPSSFKYISSKGDCYSVKYTIEVYFNDGNSLMTQTKEFRILAAQKKPRKAKYTPPVYLDAKIKQSKLKHHKDCVVLPYKQTSGQEAQDISSQAHVLHNFDMSMESPVIQKVEDGPRNPFLNSDNKILHQDDFKNSGAKSASTVHSSKHNENDSQEKGEELDQMMRGSMFFESFSCLCPGTIPLEIAVFQQVYEPNEDVDFTLVVTKVLKKISSIKLTLLMDLQVFSLTEPPHKIQELEQTLSEIVFDKKSIQKASDGQTLGLRFPLSNLVKRNKYLQMEFLEGKPNGVNLDCACANDEKISKQIKIQAQNDQIVFGFKDQEEWEQSYQFVDLATVEGEVLKVNYLVALEVTILTNFGFSKQSKEIRVPIQILKPRKDLPKTRNLNLNKEKNLQWAKDHGILIYPKLNKLETEQDYLRYQQMPGGHFKLEKTIKQ